MNAFKRLELPVTETHELFQFTSAIFTLNPSRSIHHSRHTSSLHFAVHAFLPSMEAEFEESLD